MGADITEILPPSVWWGWGDPARAKPLPEHAIALLRDRLGTDPAVTAPPVALDEVELPEPALDAAALDAIAAIVGADRVSTERLDRVEHAGGKNTPDLLSRRAGDARLAPDAVVRPSTSEAVGELLRHCVTADIAVVPFGGGTSVVGGVEPLRGGRAAVIALDLGGMAQLLSLDPVTRTARVQAGMRGPALEAALASRGFTMGHLPQSHQEATIGGYAATRSAGQASTGYGRSDELITALRVETPRGPLRLGDGAPASAAGPDLRQLFIGSEGLLGIITEVTIKIVPAPTAKAYGAWAFPSFAAGVEALRILAQEAVPGDVPEVCRLSDEEETELNLALAGGKDVELLTNYLGKRGLKRPALALFVWEGEGREPAARRRRIARVLRRAGGVSATAGPAKSWDRGRFSAPYLRDELLGRRIFVETLETAALWSNLEQTHDAVRDAIRAALAGSTGADSAIQSHVSHLYPTGASLYYTFIAAMEDDPHEQYRRVKAAASEAIVASGATITHHHAVGTEHAPYLAAEIGELGLDVLAAVKRELDPTGILNPGKLLPEPPAA